MWPFFPNNFINIVFNILFNRFTDHQSGDAPQMLVVVVILG